MLSRWIFLLLAGLMAVPANAQDLAAFWRGRVISIIVGSSAGGGYDAYARILGRHLGKHVPGNPSVVVNNMPGAASNIMAGYVASVAPRDGTVIGAPFSTQPLAAILEDAGALRYDPQKLIYIGSANEDTYVCVARRDGPLKTFADGFKVEAVMGGTAETGSTGYLPVLLNNVLGTKFKVVFGYPGSREVMMAIDKREVHGMCGLGWSTIHSQYADFLKSDRIFPLLQESIRGHAEMDRLGIPRAGDFAKSDEQKRILEIIYAQKTFGRPFFVSAETPKERVDTLANAFMDTWRDPELLAEAKRMDLEIGPISGSELQALLARIYATSDEIKGKTRQAIKVKNEEPRSR